VAAVTLQLGLNMVAGSTPREPPLAPRLSVVPVPLEPSPQIKKALYAIFGRFNE